MKKNLFKVLIMVLCCSLLTGCLGVIGEVTVNQDGSVDVVVSSGFTADAVEMMESMNEDESFTFTNTFEYKGVTYYGETEAVSYASIEEYNAAEAEDEDGENITGEIKLIQNDDGSFGMKFRATSATGNPDQLAASQGVEASEMEEEITNGMAIVVIYRFPTPVTQVSGSDVGVTIEGNVLTIDAYEMGKVINEGEEVIYEFKTAAPVENAQPAKKIEFSDVKEGTWYYAAVYALAEAGIVKGVGDGIFAPEATLTYAQFCQILAGEKGLATGAENDYWAYKAIEACRDRGYIIDLGEYTQANYDVPIPREAAVAAMYRANGAVVANTVKDTDIPDYAQIDELYKADVLCAYNAGITNGMDADRTFNPKGLLKRAEVCQLFYNLK